MDDLRKNVILIGFMGAGKTTVGRAYANRNRLSFADTDALIEESAGMTVSQIFDTMGEEKFRRLETGILIKLLSGREKTVISTGGGLPLREENQRLLKRAGVVALLNVKPETVFKRLSGDVTRPLLRGPAAKERIEGLLRLREPVYRSVADLILDTDERDAVEIAGELAERIGTFI